VLWCRTCGSDVELVFKDSPFQGEGRDAPALAAGRTGSSAVANVGQGGDAGGAGGQQGGAGGAEPTCGDGALQMGEALRTTATPSGRRLFGICRVEPTTTVRAGEQCLTVVCGDAHHGDEACDDG
jgi:hypothetical protein